MKRWLIGVLCMLSLVGCTTSPETNGIKVVSTIGMIHDIVINVGGEHVNAVALMGPGVDPHLYKATESDVNRLASADIIFYNGLHLEAKMGDVIEKMSKRARVVRVTDSIPKKKLLSPPEFEGFHDPHVWFDVQLWIKVVEKVTSALILEDPVHKADFIKNGITYVKKLRELDDYVKKESSKISMENRLLVTAHDAFGYFGKAYGFTVKGLQGISTQTEAGTRDVQALAEYIVTKKIPAIYIESAVPVRNIKAVQAACKAKGWEVKIGGELFADAMGEKGTDEGTYFGMVKHNIDTIINGITTNRITNDSH